MIRAGLYKFVLNKILMMDKFKMSFIICDNLAEKELEAIYLERKRIEEYHLSSFENTFRFFIENIRSIHWRNAIDISLFEKPFPIYLHSQPLPKELEYQTIKHSLKEDGFSLLEKYEVILFKKEFELKKKDLLNDFKAARHMRLIEEMREYIKEVKNKLSTFEFETFECIEPHFSKNGELRYNGWYLYGPETEFKPPIRFYLKEESNYTKRKDLDFLSYFRNNEKRMNLFFKTLINLQAIDKDYNWIYTAPKNSIVACFDALEEIKDNEGNYLVKRQKNIHGGKIKLFNLISQKFNNPIGKDNFRKWKYNFNTQNFFYEKLKNAFSSQNLI